MIRFEKIKSIKRVGMRDCFDLSLLGVHKGFVANGMQVHNSDFTIEDSFETFEDGIAFKKNYPDVARISMALEGQVRGAGQHAAAMCISSEDLREGKRCSIAMRNKVAVANWDKYDAEHVGLMKLDILGLSALTVLSECRDQIKVNHGVDIEYNKIDMHDAETYKEINAGNTVGIFQIGSPGLSRYCRELGVNCFKDVVDATSLWRPGTLRSGMTTIFQQRKAGAKWKSIHPRIDELTKDTYGIVLYQEQVMQFMYDLAGLPWRTCDIIRKVISKSQGNELFQSFRAKFVEGCVSKNTLDEASAGRVWDELSTFGSYGFNLSHAVEYSMITYWEMYLKVHYPAEYMAASLSYGSKEEKDDYVQESVRMGLQIILPKEKESDPHIWKAKGDKLFVPVSEIKGVGEATVAAIQKATPKRGGFFEEIAPTRKLNKGVLAKLDAIKYYDPKAVLDEHEREGVQGLFSFDISNNPMGKLKGVFNLLRSRKLIKTISEIDFTKPQKEFEWAMIRMRDLKFGYRKNVQEAKSKSTDMAGIKGNMGGAYGFIDDTTDKCMSVFSGTAYAAKKDEVEHCSGKWMLVKFNHNSVSTNIAIHDTVSSEDLLRAEFGGFDRSEKLVEKISGEFGDISGCGACKLREECSSPIPCEVGSRNIMVLGEAPGKEEDRAGKAFVGAAGKVLWKELFTKGISRDAVCVDNAVKCFPSSTKTPSKRQLDKCMLEHLDKDMAEVKPVLVLALGNTPLYALTGAEGGITNLNGTVQWISKYNCWVVWCLHPASVLHEESNRTAFCEAVGVFAERCRALGLK